MIRRIIVALTFSILCGRNEAQNGVSRAIGGTMPLRCLEKVDGGFCKALKPRFFYNEGSGRCESFYYGGCGGNGNRFDSLEECQSTCRSGFPQGRIAVPVDQNYVNKGTGYGKENARFPGWIQEERAAIPAKGWSCLSMRACSLRCPYGFMTDIYGCEECRCKIFCNLDPCPSVYCPNGKAKDANGCPICQCNRDPCYEFLCPPFQECQVVMDVTPDTYRAQCVQQATRPPCQPPNCVSKCPYDRTKADDNGCATCICWDPCERCKPNERCVIDPCMIRNDCRDYGASCLAIDQPGRAASPDMPQTTTVAPEVGLRLKEAMRKCCTTVGLVGTCLTTCETNSTLLLLDFRRCFPTSLIWSYLHCISAIDVMPKTTTVAPEARQQAAMRKCCTTVRLVGACLTTCETNSKLLLLDYTRCFPTSLIWDYMNCISVAQVDPTRWQPMMGRRLGDNIRRKRAADQPNAAEIPNENSSKNNGVKDGTKRINVMPYLPS